MSTRDRILDAAAEVMSERGIAATTTRAIAAAAGCSEALLYKYFDDKQQIFLTVLLERMPTAATPGAGEAPATLTDALTDLTERTFELFRQTFPMAVSIFGSPELLAEHRDSVRSRGFGPEGAVAIAAAQLAREQSTGRIRKDADVEAAASLLVGFAFHQAFLAVFDGREKMPADVLPGAVAVALPYLEPGVDDA